jgi:hypothetical protein
MALGCNGRDAEKTKSTKGGAGKPEPASPWLNPSESTAGQKGFRRSSRKAMNPLAEIFGFRWFARYTF